MRLGSKDIYQRISEANMNENDEFLFPVDGQITTPKTPVHETHQSSLLNDTARAALIGPYRGQTAILLTVASLGAFSFLVINLVGVLLCKGCFRKRAPSHAPSTMYMNSLSHSRRCRYSTILRRFSLESHSHSCCEYINQSGQTSSVDLYPGNRIRTAENGLVQTKIALTIPKHGTLGVNSDPGSAKQLYMPPVDRYKISTCPNPRDLLNKPRMYRTKNKGKHKRSKSFDESLFLSTMAGLPGRGQRISSGHYAQTSC